MAKVRLTHGQIGDLAISVEPGRALVVGRAARDVDVELNWDAHVSRWHARLWIDGGALWVQDLGSSNGTWIDDERVAGARRIDRAQVLRIGDTRIGLVDEDTSPVDFIDEATLPGLRGQAAWTATAPRAPEPAPLARPGDTAPIPMGAPTLRPPPSPGRPATAGPAPRPQDASAAPTPRPQDTGPMPLYRPPVGGAAPPRPQDTGPMPMLRPQDTGPTPRPHDSGAMPAAPGRASAAVPPRGAPRAPNAGVTTPPTARAPATGALPALPRPPTAGAARPSAASPHTAGATAPPLVAPSAPDARGVAVPPSSTTDAFAMFGPGAPVSAAGAVGLAPSNVGAPAPTAGAAPFAPSFTAPPSFAPNVAPIAPPHVAAFAPSFGPGAEMFDPAFAPSLGPEAFVAPRAPAAPMMPPSGSAPDAPAFAPPSASLAPRPPPPTAFGSPAPASAFAPAVPAPTPASAFAPAVPAPAPASAFAPAAPMVPPAAPSPLDAGGTGGFAALPRPPGRTSAAAPKTPTASMPATPAPFSPPIAAVTPTPTASMSAFAASPPPPIAPAPPRAATLTPIPSAAIATPPTSMSPAPPPPFAARAAAPSPPPKTPAPDPAPDTADLALAAPALAAASSASVAAASPAPEPGGAPTPAAAIRPRGPSGRFTGPSRLEIPCAGPAEFLELWSTQLARNGVFVEADAARPINSAVELRITTPTGEVSLDALIVHCSAGPNGAGIGLQLHDMSAELKQALIAYGEGRARALPGPRNAEGAAEDGDVDAAVAQARRLLDQLGSADIYRALDITPEATDAALRDRIAAIGRLMSGAAGRAPPQKAARIDAAVLALTKLGQALGDPLRRLEHDLSHGFVRAEARLAAAAAGTGPSAADLRAMWQRVAPERAARATAQSRDAFAAQGRGDNAEALRLARSALNDNPFLEELRAVMRTWEKGDDDLPTRRARSQSTTRARR